MPVFDLRGIKVAQYANNNGTITYSNSTSAGDAMTANLDLTFAEGRLYAEGKLAEAQTLLGNVTEQFKALQDSEEAAELKEGVSTFFADLLKGLDDYGAKK